MFLSQVCVLTKLYLNYDIKHETYQPSMDVIDLHIFHSFSRLIGLSDIFFQISHYLYYYIKIISLWCTRLIFIVIL